MFNPCFMVFRYIKLSKIASLLAVIIFFAACKQKVSEISPERKDIVESVYASATIKSANQYALYSNVSGLLLSLLVKEGDSVIEGQVIAVLDNENPGLQAENARLAMELSRKNLGNLDELKSQLNTARNQATLDSINYQRQLHLWSKDVGTKAQLEKAKLMYDASANNLKALQVRYIQTRSQLNAALQQAENQYGITQKSSGDFLVKSRINGRVYSLNYKAGELVTQQKAVALLGSKGQFIVELSIDEVDIARVATGMKVLLTLESYPQKVFEARLSRVLPNIDSRTQTFLAEAEFTSAPPALYPGLTAEASIVISKKANALLIPLNYLKTDSSVLTKKGEVKVLTGVRSLEKVEILSGITEQTTLIKP